MTDNITRILVNAKKIFRTKNNNLSYVVIADDENGKEINYILNFNYDGITLGRTIVNNNKIEVITNNQEYDRNLFLSILANYDILVGNIDEFNNTVNFTLNTIPAMVFSNSVFKKEGYDGEEIYDGDKYIDDFISYNNRNNLIDSNNYFTFLKVTVEASNIEIFDYLRFTYNEYMNNLSEEQMAILIYTACKRNPTFIEKMHELDFTFGFELLRLTVDNNDCKILEYLYSIGIDIDVAASYRFRYLYLVTNILDYAFKKNANVEIVKLLINYNIKIFGNCYIAGYIERNPSIVQILFERKDIKNLLEMKIGFYDTLAHVIARNENPGVVNLLFEKEDINDILRISNGIGWTVAHRVTRNKNPEIVKLLFERDNINDILIFKDHIDRTVAHLIAENKNHEIVKLLFERDGIDDILRMSDKDGWTVAHAVAGNENHEIVKLLFERDGIDDILRMLDKDGWTVTHVVAGNKNPEIVKLLFERNDIDDILKIRNKNGLSVAHMIAFNKNPEVIKLLLNRKNIELEKEDIDLIKENFINNEEITDLLLARELISTNDAINEAKICTIC